MTESTAPDSIELHDAVIESLSLDFGSGKLLLSISCYKSADVKERSPLSVAFVDVVSVGGLLDCARLDLNRKFGNVNYWVPGEVTYIYLSDGFLSVTAKSIECIFGHAVQ